MKMSMTSQAPWACRHLRLGRPSSSANALDEGCVSQPAGLFSAAALYGLADVSGTFLAMRNSPSDKFPCAINTTINLLANTDRGSAVSTSTLIKAGGTLIVTNTVIHDGAHRALCAVIGTFCCADPSMPPDPPRVWAARPARAGRRSRRHRNRAGCGR